MKNILIYQPSKVGSSSVLSVIDESLALGRTTQGSVVICPNHGLDNKLPDLETKLYHVHGRYDFSPTLEKRIYNSKNVIVTMVREPISRHISSLFEMPAFKNQSINTDNSSHFFKSVMTEGVVNNGMDWYDINLNVDPFNIDVFSKEFDHEKGYNIYENENTICLLIRTDKIGDYSFIKEFFNLDKLDLQGANNNQTRNKPGIGNHYENFKKTLKLDKEYLNSIYSHKVCKHFFTEEEITNFINKWS